ncbi:expressed unknown protein [Seminavis robusta]|uniref:Uncharacterized protein n=1 Tax=Seminavis robusta TaxID=568900 RepID=A0A9N8HGR8_9STRA|nr:expressed unknown protein [Seminavis robusta]|eukprot:Sro410_g137360.1 n/a (146) ;mRNA; f:23187-23624
MNSFITSLLGTLETADVTIIDDNAGGKSLLNKRAARRPASAASIESLERWQERKAQTRKESLAPPSPPFRRIHSNEETTVSRWRACRKPQEPARLECDQKQDGASPVHPPHAPCRRGSIERRTEGEEMSLCSDSIVAFLSTCEAA